MLLSLMKNTVLISGAFLLLVAGGTASAGELGEDCVGIENDISRLECFDNAFATNDEITDLQALFEEHSKLARSREYHDFVDGLGRRIVRTMSIETSFDDSNCSYAIVNVQSEYIYGVGGNFQETALMMDMRQVKDFSVNFNKLPVFVMSRGTQLWSYFPQGQQMSTPPSPELIENIVLELANNSVEIVTELKAGNIPNLPGRFGRQAHNKYSETNSNSYLPSFFTDESRVDANEIIGTLASLIKSCQAK